MRPGRYSAARGTRMSRQRGEGKGRPQCQSAAQLAYLRAVDFTMSTLTALSSRSTLPAVHTVQQRLCAVAMVSQLELAI